MKPKAQETVYICEKCRARYNLAEARAKGLSCCGRPLKNVAIKKNKPTPLGS